MYWIWIWIISRQGPRTEASHSLRLVRTENYQKETVNERWLAQDPKSIKWVQWSTNSPWLMDICIIRDRLHTVIVTSNWLNACGLQMPASPSVSCFSPMLSGLLLVDLLHITIPYRLPMLCVGVLLLFSSSIPKTSVFNFLSSDVQRMCLKGCTLLSVTVCGDGPPYLGAAIAKGYG